MNDLVVRSTSPASAPCTDIILRETNVTRLVFRPQLVDNPNSQLASVDGDFIFQRKGPKDNWADIPTNRLSSLKKDESYKVTLKAAELLKLYQELTQLYALYEKNGIPRGKVTYVRASEELKHLAGLPVEEIHKFVNADRIVGASLITKLLAWVISLPEPEILITLLVSLGSDAVRKLNAAVGIQVLKQTLSSLNENQRNNNEEFWQNMLTDNSFILEQTFSWPCSIVKDKAYVGGKNITNTGGKIVDFLVNNSYTKNAALIEIKTPATPLLASEYRKGIFNISDDLSGSVLQVLDYKCNLEHEYNNLQAQLTPNERFHSFDPKCVVIIGKVSTLTTPEQIKSFELFRNQLTNVIIIGFDELFEKLSKLIMTLEMAPAVEEEDVPF